MDELMDKIFAVCERRPALTLLIIAVFYMAAFVLKIIP